MKRLTALLLMTLLATPCAAGAADLPVAGESDLAIAGEPDLMKAGKPDLPVAGAAHLAAAQFDPAVFERTPGYAFDAESGAWRVAAGAADALMEELSRTNVARACLMRLEYQGNAATGLIQPVLVWDVVGEALNADAVSILLDGVRYDVQVLREAEKLGERKVERLTAPLTREGMALLAALGQADVVKLRFHGKKTYTTEIDLNYAGSDAKKKLEAGARHCLTLQGAPDLSDYALWDLNAAAWQAAHAFAPCIQRTPFPGKLSDMVSPGTSGSRVRALEKALISAGYLAGSADATYTTRTRDAIKRAQKALGRIESGSGDAALLAQLTQGAHDSESTDGSGRAQGSESADGSGRAQGNESADGSGRAQGSESADGSESARGSENTDGSGCVQGSENTRGSENTDGSGRARALCALPGASISIDRYWFARRVMPSVPTDPDAGYALANSDNLLMVCEGLLENTGEAVLQPDWAIEATLTLSGRAYPCKLLIEKDGGTAFGDALLPLGTSRLLVASEIPKAAAGQAGMLTLEIAGAQAAFALLAR
ncbi:MAG: peptidoglycan-binding protein [Clostridia bacterium]